jgi:hypothetical protein
MGIQVHLNNIMPYFSGNQTKMAYYKKRDYLAIPRKPNIYLYPETTTRVKVTLISQKGNYITISIPPYNNGWEVTAEPSGIIDGEYEYLFYEGSEIKLHSTNFGWSVSASELWQFLPEKMVEYGFNEKEIKDFVSYWQVHLPQSEYYEIIPNN